MSKKEGSKKELAATTVPTEGDNAAKEIEQFFKDNPTAQSVLRVGDALFLNIYKGAAVDFARRNNLEVQTVENPNL